MENTRAFAFSPRASRPSTDELRHLYFLDNLASSIVGFGDGKIIDWLNGQRSAAVPDSNIWIEHLSKLAEAMEDPEADVLRRCADPWDPRVGAVAEISPEFLEIVSALDPYKASIYWGSDYGPLFYFAQTGNILSAFEVCNTQDGPIKRIEMEEVSLQAVLRALLATWRAGGRRARAAREYLCQTFDTAIDDIRHRVNQEFEYCIAAQLNGQEIAVAERVVLYRIHQSAFEAFVYPGGRFMPAQLELQPNIPEYSFPGVEFVEFVHPDSTGKSRLERTISKLPLVKFQAFLIKFKEGDVFLSRLDALGAGTTQFPPGGVRLT